MKSDVVGFHLRELVHKFIVTNIDTFPDWKKTSRGEYAIFGILAKNLCATL